MRLHEKAEEAWTQFKREAEQHGAENAESEEFGDYTERDPISESWNTRGRIIRLDDAVMAMHVMAARHSFRGIAALKQKLATQLREFVIGMIGNAAARKVIGRVIGRNAISQFVGLIANTISDIGVQREVESSIRIASFEVRSDLYRQPLGPNPKRPRKTKLVYTRHPIPKQRRTNTGWRSPR